MIETYNIIALLLTGLYLLVLGFMIKGWAALKTPRIKLSGFNTKVTVLIAARNEEESIHLTIEDILAQDYPKELTEIIIVDDHSTDRTSDVIKSYAHRGVKLLQLNEDKPLNSYKKKAISEAIALSTGDLMVATDADCRMGSKWLSTVVGYYEAEGPVMISSPVSFFQERSLFELMQTLEFSYLTGVGGAFIGNGRASTCNGANLAYRKDVFYEVGGFPGIDDLASGDDELLLQKVAQRFPGRIGFTKCIEAVVYTHAKHNLTEFLQQRRRWASKSTRYKDKKIVLLATGIWLYNVCLLISLLLSLFSREVLLLTLLQFSLKIIFEAVFLYPVLLFYQRPKLLWLTLLVSPAHIVYLVYIGLISNNTQYMWKGRMVR